MDEKIKELLAIAQKTHASTQSLIDEVIRFYEFDNFNPGHVRIDILNIHARCNEMEKLANAIEKIQSELLGKK